MLDSTGEQTSFSSGQNGQLERYGARTYICLASREGNSGAIMLKTLVLLKKQ